MEIKNDTKQKFTSMANEYIDCAEFILDKHKTWHSHLEPDNVVFFLIRHYLELYLKHFLLVLRSYKKEDTKISDINNHNLAKIFNKIDSEIKETVLFEFIKTHEYDTALLDAKKFISSISKLDATSQKKRYPAFIEKKDISAKILANRLFVDPTYDPICGEYKSCSITNAKTLLEQAKDIIADLDWVINPFEKSIIIDLSLNNKLFNESYSYYELYSLLALKKNLASAEINEMIKNEYINSKLIIAPYIGERANLKYLNLDDINDFIQDAKKYIWWSSIEVINNASLPLDHIENITFNLENVNCSYHWNIADNKIIEIYNKFGHKKMAELYFLYYMARDKCVHFGSSYERHLEECIDELHQMKLELLHKLFRRDCLDMLMLGLSALGIVSDINKNHLQFTTLLTI